MIHTPKLSPPKPDIKLVIPTRVSCVWFYKSNLITFEFLLPGESQVGFIGNGFIHRKFQEINYETG